MFTFELELQMFVNKSHDMYYVNKTVVKQNISCLWQNSYRTIVAALQDGNFFVKNQAVFFCFVNVLVTRSLLYRKWAINFAILEMEALMY